MVEGRDEIVARVATILFPVIYPGAAKDLADGIDTEWGPAHVRAAEAVVDGLGLRTRVLNVTGPDDRPDTVTTLWTGWGQRRPGSPSPTPPTPPGAPHEQDPHRD